MGKQRKPRVTVNCVANHYAGPTERIVEFSFPDGRGGLISFITLDDGTPSVQVYNYDAGIEVRAGKPQPEAHN